MTVWRLVFWLAWHAVRGHGRSVAAVVIDGLSPGAAGELRRRNWTVNAVEDHSVGWLLLIAGPRQRRSQPSTYRHTRTGERS